MTRKRGFIEIIAIMLEVLSEKPLKKSHISFKSYLDSRAVTKYLRIMEQLGLVKKSENEPSEFISTQKGKNFFEQYQKLVKMLKK